MDICVTADDYGLSPGTNASIEALAAAGKLSAVSVMGHRDADLSSVARLAGAGVAVGLHLCFTAARPFVAALAGRDGLLPASHLHLFAALAGRPSLLPLLRAEAEAQADRLLAAGVPLAFVNGHEHVHLFPPLWPLVAALARRLRVPAVRSALGQPLALSSAGALSAASRLSWALAPLPEVAVLSPLGVGLAGALTIDAVDALLCRPFAPAARRARELCFHPALDAPGRRAEHELLAEGAIGDLLRRRGLVVARGVGSRQGH
jgi:hypothetical protein